MTASSVDQGLVRLEACVRPETVDRTVHALRDAGALRVTVLHGHAVGAGADPATAKPSLEEGMAAADISVIHVVCTSVLAPALTAAVLRAARTGRRGDGIVVESPVTAVTKIRTGVTGPEALR